MQTRSLILKNQYHDSVVLMRVSQQLKDQPGVEDAALIMGTEVNKELLAQGKLLTQEANSAQANDLIIVVTCEQDADDLLALAQKMLVAKQPPAAVGVSAPSTLRSAVRADPALNMAVISVAGAYAVREAREALAAGLLVLLFSDNVPLQDEIALKRFAVERGLLLMGPGAGTSIINGVGLGFANALRREHIGIVSAAGTGLQEVSSLITQYGGGVSQAIGTGGRDLHAEVGGLTFFAAIQALQADPNTYVLVLISKPPAPEVVERLVDQLQGSQKPVVLCLLGAQELGEDSENLHFTSTLEECAQRAFALAEPSSTRIPSFTDDGILMKDVPRKRAGLLPEQRYLRGLFSGGTLCYEAQAVWRTLLEEKVYSNAPIQKDLLRSDADRWGCHYVVDLGEEEFTKGRPHPMIDNTLRIERMWQEARHPETAVIFLDLVIGYGAHPDPAGEIGEAIRDMRRELQQNEREVIFVASVTGTEFDPQGLTPSREILHSSGVLVCSSNAQAARLAARLVEKR